MTEQNEPKKPTETEIIRAQIALGRQAINDAMTTLAEGSSKQYVYECCLQALERRLGDIERANEARDKSRTLSVAFTAYDFTQPLVTALLSQGYELALRDVVPCLKTVKTGPGSILSWNPPINPFEGPRSGHSRAPDPPAPVAPSCTCGAKLDEGETHAWSCPLYTEHTCASTRGRECDCPGTTCVVGSR